jgi:PAS domain S-box-containing protein
LAKNQAKQQKKSASSGDTGISRRGSSLIEKYRHMSPGVRGETARRTHLVNIIGLTIFTGALVLLIIETVSLALNPALSSASPISDLIYELIGIVVGGLTYLFNRRGRNRLAGWLIVLSLLVITVGKNYTEGNPYTDPIGAIALLMVVAVAIVVLDFKEAFLVFVLTFASYFTLARLWLAGRLPEPIERDPRSATSFMLLAWLIVSGMVATVIASAQNALRRWAGRLEQEVADRTAELQQTSERLAVILNNTPDAILLLSPDGTIRQVNPICKVLFGRSIDELEGRPLQTLLAPHFREGFEAGLLGVTAHRQTVRLEVTSLRQDGSTFDAELAMAPVHEKDLVGVVCSLRDISAVKAVERMKASFLSTAAHELRTPLTSIRGFSQILLTRELNGERHHRYLEFIDRQAQQLARIIDSLLDVTRLESGRGLELKIELIDIAQLVNQVVQPFSEGANEHTIRVADLDGLPPVNGDRSRLEQVIWNLLSNAVKYSPDGGTITIRGREKVDRIEIDVQDEGIGISLEDQKQVFEQFFRSDEVFNEIGGTGLGLTISKLIVELHGGTILLESEPGKGSTFSFCLPLPDQSQSCREGNPKTTP